MLVTFNYTVTLLETLVTAALPLAAIGLVALSALTPRLFMQLQLAAFVRLLVVIFNLHPYVFISLLFIIALGATRMAFLFFCSYLLRKTWLTTEHTIQQTCSSLVEQLHFTAARNSIYLVMPRLIDVYLMVAPLSLGIPLLTVISAQPDFTDLYSVLINYTLWAFGLTGVLTSTLFATASTLLTLFTPLIQQTNLFFTADVSIYVQADGRKNQAEPSLETLSGGFLAGLTVFRFILIYQSTETETHCMMRGVKGFLGSENTARASSLATQDRLQSNYQMAASVDKRSPRAHIKLARLMITKDLDMRQRLFMRPPADLSQREVFAQNHDLVVATEAAFMEKLSGTAFHRFVSENHPQSNLNQGPAMMFQSLPMFGCGDEGLYICWQMKIAGHSGRGDYVKSRLPFRNETSLRQRLRLIPANKFWHVHSRKTYYGIQHLNDQFGSLGKLINRYIIANTRTKMGGYTTRLDLTLMNTDDSNKFALRVHETTVYLAGRNTVYTNAGSQVDRVFVIDKDLISAEEIELFYQLAERLGLDKPDIHRAIVAKVSELEATITPQLRLRTSSGTPITDLVFSGTKNRPANWYKNVDGEVLKILNLDHSENKQRFERMEYKVAYQKELSRLKQSYGDILRYNGKR